jgi:hypothetical protein
MVFIKIELAPKLNLCSGKRVLFGLFIAHAPDADIEKHQTLIETGKYKLYTYVIRTQEVAIKVCMVRFQLKSNPNNPESFTGSKTH